MLAYSIDSVSDEKTDGFVTNCHPYFFGKEYNKLVSDIQGLRDLIENTETGQRDAEEKENLHADLVSLGSRVEQDLATIRVKLDQHFRQSSCRFKSRWTPYVNEDNLDPLERGVDGHVIFDLRLIRKSRMAKMGRSPEAQYAYHIGHRLGLIPGLSMWGFARIVALCLGEDPSWVMWAVIVLWFAYICRPKYIDYYPSMRPAREIEMAFWLR